MTINKGKKKTGKKYIKERKKKKYEVHGQKNIIKIGGEKRKTKKARGGNKKLTLLRAKFVNIQSKGKKQKKAEIKDVLETPSKKFLARQNIITKGTIVKTDLGKVRITNRPGQEGVVNGVLID